MIRRKINIAGWEGVFLFSTGGYDDEEIYRQLVSCDAPASVFHSVSANLAEGMMNEGFTFSSPPLRRSVVYFGPTTDGGQFMSTFCHELGHFAIDICVTDGVDLESEKLCYLAGEVALRLSDIVCHLACDHCREV